VILKAGRGTACLDRSLARRREKEGPEGASNLRKNLNKRADPGRRLVKGESKRDRKQITTGKNRRGMSSRGVSVF